MKIKEIMNVRDVFSNYINKELPIKLAYKISKFIEDTNSDYDFYFEKVKELFSKYSEKDENGNYVKNENGIKIKKEFEEKFKIDLEELQNIESNSQIKYFSLDDFGDLKCSIKEIIILNKIIK